MALNLEVGRRQGEQDLKSTQDSRTCRKVSPGQTGAGDGETQEEGLHGSLLMISVGTLQVGGERKIQKQWMGGHPGSKNSKIVAHKIFPEKNPKAFWGQINTHWHGKSSKKSHSKETVFT